VEIEFIDQPIRFRLHGLASVAPGDRTRRGGFASTDRLRLVVQSVGNSQAHSNHAGPARNQIARRSLFALLCLKFPSRECSSLAVLVPIAIAPWLRSASVLGSCLMSASNRAQRRMNIAAVCPQIKSLQVEFVQPDRNRDRQPEYIGYDETTLVGYIKCLNPRGAKIAFEIAPLLHEMVTSRTIDRKVTARCDGEEIPCRNTMHGANRKVCLRRRISRCNPEGVQRITELKVKTPSGRNHRYSLNNHASRISTAPTAKTASRADLPAHECSWPRCSRFPKTFALVTPAATPLNCRLVARIRLAAETVGQGGKPAARKSHETRQC
jgi:hypothetical protein